MKKSAANHARSVENPNRSTSVDARRLARPEQARYAGPEGVGHLLSIAPFPFGVSLRCPAIARRVREARIHERTAFSVGDGDQPSAVRKCVLAKTVQCNFCKLK